MTIASRSILGNCRNWQTFSWVRWKSTLQLDKSTTFLTPIDTIQPSECMRLDKTIMIIGRPVPLQYKRLKQEMVLRSSEDKMHERGHDAAVTIIASPFRSLIEDCQTDIYTAASLHVRMVNAKHRSPSYPPTRTKHSANWKPSKCHFRANSQWSKFHLWCGPDSSKDAYQKLAITLPTTRISAQTSTQNRVSRAMTVYFREQEKKSEIGCGVLDQTLTLQHLYRAFRRIIRYPSVSHLPDMYEAIPEKKFLKNSFDK
ncbi:hypothetical protein CLF_112678 [Clonorchis sinensis]|uniref:Uncharacterized protein n=1 Tax=Clonorchis sinensis TaxID=79923 RepID=G7YWS8_CLOSI|nr:hypothetical protein CLF_112678 [Clonorchis sinensis]